MATTNPIGDAYGATRPRRRLVPAVPGAPADPTTPPAVTGPQDPEENKPADGPDDTPPQGQTLPDDPPAPTWGGRDTATPYTAAADQSSWDSNEYAKPAYTAARYNPVAESGYDTTKWNSPTHQTPKYVVSRILSGYDLKDPRQLQAAVGDIQKAYPGTTWGGRDVVTIPGIGDVDIVRDFGGESGIAWQPIAAPGAGGTMTAGGAMAGGTATPGAFGAGAGGGLGALSSSGAASSTLTSGRPVDPALDAARRSALLEMLGRGTPTPEELRDSPENRAYLLQSQRAAERDRAGLAERAAFEGFDNSGYFDTELGGLNQERAEGEAGFLGQVAISRMAAHREDLQFAIAQAQQSGQFEMAQQLDQQRMMLDAAIQREQMDLNRTQFNNRLGYDYTALALDANRDAVDWSTDYS